VKKQTRHERLFFFSYFLVFLFISSDDNGSGYDPKTMRSQRGVRLRPTYAYKNRGKRTGTEIALHKNVYVHTRAQCTMHNINISSTSLANGERRISRRGPFAQTCGKFVRRRHVYVFRPKPDYFSGFSNDSLAFVRKMIFARPEFYRQIFLLTNRCFFFHSHPPLFPVRRSGTRVFARRVYYHVRYSS